MCHIKRLLVLTSLACAVGCGLKSPTGTSPQPSDEPVSTTASSGPAPADEAVPPELVKKVDALIELNNRYCELTKQIQDSGTFREHADELSRLDQESSSVTEDIMIAEAKLTPAQKAALDREHFTPRAQPTIDRKRQEKERVLKLTN